MLPPPPRSTLFPYTTLFRSHGSVTSSSREGAGCGAGRRCLRSRGFAAARSEEHTSELQSHSDLVCRLLLEKKKIGWRQADAEEAKGANDDDVVTGAQAQVDD